MSDIIKVKNRTANSISEGPRARLLSWLHNIHPGVAMKLGMILVVCIATLLIGASFILSSYLSRELQVNALEMIKTGEIRDGKTVLLLNYLQTSHLMD